MALSKSPMVVSTTKAFLEHLCFEHNIADDFKHGNVNFSAVVLFIRAFKLAHFDEALALNQSDNAKKFAALARTMMARFEEVLTGYASRRLVSSSGFVAAAKEFFAFSLAFESEEREFMTKKLHQLLMIYYLSETPETNPEVREMRGLLGELGGPAAVAELDKGKLHMTAVLTSIGRWPLGNNTLFDLQGDRLVVRAYEEPTSSVVTPPAEASAPAA